MKGHKSIRKILEQSFTRVQTLPAADSKPAWERLMDRRRENLEGVFEGAEFADPVRFQPSRVRPLWAAVAAAAVFAVVFSVAFRPAAPAVMEDVAGSLNIGFGEVVRSSDNTAQRLVLADGSRIEMRSKSELWLERAEDGVRIQLRNGGIIVTAAKQRTGHLYVQTKDVTVSVVGTVFLVNAEAEGSRVAVIEGEVRVQQKGATEQKLGPGEQVSTNPKMESIPLQKEVDWSRDAVAHVATLGQAAASTAPAQKEERVAFEVATIRPSAPAAAPAGLNTRGGGGAQADRSCIPGAGHVQLDPRRFNIRGASLHELVALAYGTCDDVKGRLSGGPEWVKSETWDIEALIPEGSVDPLPTTAFGGPTTELMKDRSPKVQKMVRTLVEERFKVAVRREMKEMPVYVLTVAPGGPKFQGNDFSYGVMMRGAGGAQPGLNRGTPFEGLASAAQGAETIGSRTGACLKYSGFYDNPGQRQGGLPSCQVFTFLNQFMDQVAIAMSASSNFFADRRVINRTGVQEKVSFAIDWDPGAFVPGQLPQPLKFQGMLKALEPVGLQLKEEPKGLVEFFVIDRAEKPSEN
jgi:uncharacterized protein (TIGR03435 family)